MREAERTTIVLVHGAWHGGWCWAQVADALRQREFDVVVVDLPGHEAPGHSKRIWERVGGYVRHVDTVVRSIEGRVVLVGHSMGGLIVQRVIETRPVHGAVLVASVPRRGVIVALARLARRDPMQVAQSIVSVSLWPMVENDERARKHFFTEQTDADTVEAAGAKLQNESFLAFLSMLARHPRPKLARTENVCVIGATRDGIFTRDEQHDLAAAYGTDLIEIDAGHDLMLESSWPELVGHIAEFAG